MSDYQDYVLTLCAQIVRSGQKPSVALIKKSATKPIPLPDIVAVLQRWKEDDSILANVVDRPAPASQPHSSSVEEQLTLLIARVSALEKELAELKAKL